MKRLITFLPVFSLLAASLFSSIAVAQDAVTVYFTNQTSTPANVSWVNGNTNQYYMTVAPGQTQVQQTYIGHNWSFSTENNREGAMGGPVTHNGQVFRLARAAGVSAPIVDPVYPPVRNPPVYPPQQRTSAVNQAVVNYARSVVGQRIGNGQCTELAIAALRAAGAQPNRGYIWGTRLNSYRDLQPGDIIQMQNARFQYSWSYGPHTAIVTDISGSTIHVLEQNVDGSPVQAGQFDMNTMTGGTLTCYRPIAGSGNSGGGRIGGGNTGRGGFNGPRFGQPRQPRDLIGELVWSLLD
jgi:hypothetical protein